MKGTNLGELEELIMLTVALLYDEAYGVAIQKEIKKRCNRTITISTVHAALARLQNKGYVDSRYAGATPERGGRRKHLFQVTKSGQKVLEQVKEQRNAIWDAIPGMAFNN
ncbi:PadR family transcriptional regulator [Ekhidna sp. To15]|uniref:PadR family transcriptional regulator n=1 Tax=Ekhidna sp. To15 TaxID=3395267 RepID=UPI003F525917